MNSIPAEPTLYRRFGKRLLDVALGGAALALAAPLGLVAGALVKATSPGPVFFVQERLGRGGRPFRMLKFRTMTDAPRDPGRQVHGRDPGVTPVGRWLRRFKVDELPQLVNVLRGEMSLVGPRPDLPQHLERYDARARRRLAVRPGMTGLAQVSGNVALSWPERWEQDVYYARHRSARLDAAILLRTVLVLLRGETHYRHQPLVHISGSTAQDVH